MNFGQVLSLPSGSIGQMNPFLLLQKLSFETQTLGTAFAYHICAAYQVTDPLLARLLYVNYVPPPRRLLLIPLDVIIYPLSKLLPILPFVSFHTPPHYYPQY